MKPWATCHPIQANIRSGSYSRAIERCAAAAFNASRSGKAPGPIIYARCFRTRCANGRPRTHRDTCAMLISPRRYGSDQQRYASQHSDSGDALKRTALYDLHIANGGQMVPFGGYSMPVHYRDLGIGESHKWTREKASLFDVGHM